MKTFYRSIKSLARKAFFWIMRYSGVPYLIREVFQSNKVTVLVYHDINPKSAKLHFDYIRSKYNVISLEEYINSRLNNSSAKLLKKSVILTIDDGLKSNYYLGDILKKDNIPLTIFLTSGICGTNKHFWFREESNQAQVEKLKLVSDDERLEYLKPTGYTDATEYSERQALSFDEISELKEFVDFQSHTVTHPILPNCSDEKAEFELAQSKADIEKATGKRVYAIAYPNGDYSDRDIEAVRKAGYTCGLTVDFGFNTDKTDLFRLKRIGISDSADLDQLVCSVCGLWPYLRTLRRKISAKSS